jgi:hypothetical protein
MQVNEDQALIFVGQLSRTINYPRDPEQIVAMAQALIRAAEATNVEADQIIRECAETSQYCPTDRDLLSVARDIKERVERARDAADVRAPWDRNPACPKCNSSGWIIKSWLHTYYHDHAEKEEISKTEADRMWPKIGNGPQRQMIYETAQKCACRMGKPK